MATGVFYVRKRTAAICAATFFALSCVAFSVFALCFSAQRLPLGYAFYYLVSDSENVEASVYAAKSDGGAGFVLPQKTQSVVAWSVYLTERDGLSVCAALQESGKAYRLEAMYLEHLRVRGAKKKQSGRLIGLFRSMYGSLMLLEQEIFRLDKGATQESSRRILRELGKQLAYLEKTCVADFPECAVFCADMKIAVEAAAESTIYGKELRNLLCESCYRYVQLGKKPFA